MAEWRARGYVQDSDEEDDSQNSTLVGLTASREVVNIHDTAALEGGEPHDVGTHNGQNERGGWQDGNGQKSTSARNAGEEGSSTGTAALWVQREKESTRSLVIGYDGHDAENNIIDTYEDLDELQQDHYSAISTAQPEARTLNGAHDLEARPRSSPISPSQISFLSSPSSSPLPEMFNIDYKTPSTSGTLRSARRTQNDDRESSIDGGPQPLNSDTQHNTTKEAEPLVFNQTHEPYRAARNLRHRNAIQLHPYAVESEQYRQTLKARGVKPLRIAQMEADAAKAREQDSQNIEFDGEEDHSVDSDNERPAPSSSPPIHPEGSSAALSHDRGDIFVFGDDELPDMNTLLRHSTLKYVGNGHKRRKTLKAKSTAFRAPQDLDLNGGRSPLSNQASSKLTDDDVLFDVPPSPPHSGSQTPRGTDRSALPAFRMPRMPSPAVLPTPITSSEPRRRQLLEIFEDEQPDSHSQRTRRMTDTEDSTDAEAPPSDKETYHQLQRAQRKIRGVLPASWLKLDLKTQGKKPADTHKSLPSMSPEKRITQRGVARTVFAPGGKSSGAPELRHEIEMLSDDDDPESKIDELPQQTRARPRQQHMLEDRVEDGLFVERWGEAAEDDDIDAMLPSVKRAFHTRKGSKRQTKIRDFHSRAQVTAHGTSEKASSSSAHQHGIKGHVNQGRKKKPKFRPPRLGILDAPLSKGSPQGFVPSFLKIASRTARSRHDKGRHSPSRKFVRLATRDDDKDANDTLRSWREGTIPSSANFQVNEVPTRQPLYPRSANSPMSSRESETGRSRQNSKLSASRTTSTKPHLRPTKPRKLQTSLDQLIERRERDGHDPIQRQNKRGQVVSSLRATKDSRPAMLESTREDADRTHAQAMFHQDLARVNRFDDDSGLPGVVVRRFLGEGGMQPLIMDSPQKDRVIVGQHANGASANTKSLPRRKRKRRPQRLNVPDTWAREPSAPLILNDYPDQAINSSKTSRRHALIGLGPFGTRYSDTFDVTPLPTGTCFSTNSLLGSGAFARALKIVVTANLGCSRGYALLSFNDRNLRWGPWNDTVSSELGEVFEAISQWVQNAAGQNLGPLIVQTYEQVMLLQNSVLEYFSNHLSFLDPVDRIAYVLRCKGLLSTLVAELIDHNAVTKTTNHQVSDNLPKALQISTLTLSITNQLRQISKHDLIPLELQDHVRLLTDRLSQHTLDLSLAKGLEPFRTCLSKLRGADADYRIQDDFIEAFVAVQHVLGQDQGYKTSVWLTLLKAVPSKSPDGAFDITLAEQIWKEVFTLLPFLELDAQGVVETGRRFKISFENWTLAKRLLDPLLEASSHNPQGQPPSFNCYCRVAFGRCLHLINGWGWRRCESIIGVIFDYFARNSLGHLRSEESKGSPLFLERLNKNPTLILEPEDRAFHILLKIIGSGLRHMRRSYPEKKIRDLVWRLMPNHGRSHPKEEAIRQEHLDALRNHHDLLCTLYWASPPSCRPRLTVIRNLVNLETSHREACHINIRAWFNLVKFQLSTDEPISELEAFSEWHSHLLTQIIRQHNLARTEVEEQVRSAQSVNGLTVSKELLETTIARNQRQVEAVLSDALVCLKLAIDVAHDVKAASMLPSTTLARVFELFDASKTQANQPIIQALDVLAACASKSFDSRDGNEESQDYGDWSAFDDDSSAIPPPEDNASPFTLFQEPLRHLLWNCFGSDLVPHDALLLKLVDVWVVVAQVMVRNRLKSWADYLDRCGNDSWSSLRNTEQTRKYSVYYLATLIERDSKIYHDDKASFLKSWVGSLVERESLLKFQHRLTSALLSIDSENPLLHNLPFWKDAANGHYQIAASDFSDRRLSLISSVLSNMRVSLESAVSNPSVNGNGLRQDFRDLLKHLMARMKDNYQELGPGSNIKGAYVDFVHRVVEFLQQHTSMICPVDRFFTDNGTFPLPATDPTYVVGQLKNYALRLQEARTPKQLVIFLQSVSERAAVDGQQPYLVSQLHAAMSNAFEDGASSTPTLRSFLVKNIVPAYVEMAFSTACGWVLAMPYLQALQEVFGELLKDLDGANSGSVAAIASTIVAFLNATRHSLELLIDCSGELRSRDAGTLKAGSACYSAISALLPVIDYVVRLPKPIPPTIVDNIAFFQSFALHFSAVLCGDSDPDSLLLDRNERARTGTSISSDIRRFATQELRDTLGKNWSCHDGQYYLVRGSTRREVVVDIGLYEEERAQLLVVLREFFDVLGMMPALGEEDDDGVLFARRETKLLLVGDDELLF